MSNDTNSIVRRIHPQQMEAWISKLQINMRTFIDKEITDPAERLEFIRQQYALLDVVIKVLNGSVYFTGCSHPAING